MSDPFPHNPFRRQSGDMVGIYKPLPWWVADRLLAEGEKVTWVRSPRFNPFWERYVTHPFLALLALAIGAVAVVSAWPIHETQPETFAVVFIAAGGLVVASIIVLGIANGYFTRLVVTNYRLVILQGYEVCRGWHIDELPPSLVRYGPPGSGATERAIDLESVKTLLGGRSDKFTDAKSILALGKQLDQITLRENRRL